MSFTGVEHAAANVSFLSDMTWVDSEGARHESQQIFNTVFEMIRNARHLVLLDMFLYNDFQMGVSNPARPLSRQLTDLLLQQKKAYPDIRIVVITDPINTVYGSVPCAAFAELKAANIDVVITDLGQLRDSNPVYSFFWRLFLRPLGNSARGHLPNPFDPRSKVTLRSYLAMLNFKGNHRKVLVTDDAGSMVGLVSSANSHDASCTNINVACRFTGAAVNDLVATENAVLELSGRTPLTISANASEHSGDVTVQVVTERAIKSAALDLINNLHFDEQLDLAFFFLADRDVIGALKNAANRGVQLRVLLDPNNDSFGQARHGIPNRPVAAELVNSGIEIRWSDTHGEQCHQKMLLGVNNKQQAKLLLGSANMTRRNLDDFNLETDVLIRASLSAPVLADALTHFDSLWNNRPEQVFSVPYEYYSDETVFKRGFCRFMEATGFSTF